MGRLRVLRRTWRMGGGGSVLQLQQLLLRRCNNMSGHIQDADPPVLHGPFGNASVRVVQPGVLSRSSLVLNHGVPGELDLRRVGGHRGWW